MASRFIHYADLVGSRTMNWVLTVRVDADDSELELILADLYARLGDRVRVLTQQAWLFDEGRRKPGSFAVPQPVWNGPKDRR